MTIGKLSKNVWQTIQKEVLVWSSDRYPIIPDNLRSFLCSFEKLESIDGKSWILSAKDFHSSSINEFSFDEFEKISLNAAEDDLEWKSEIINFWNVHVPVYLSVKDGYEYIAYNLQTNEFVCGNEPEFEETSFVANTINDFITYINNKNT